VHTIISSKFRPLPIEQLLPYPQTLDSTKTLGWGNSHVDFTALPVAKKSLVTFPLFDEVNTVFFTNVTADKLVLILDNV
jgi:hypothetical protein